MPSTPSAPIEPVPREGPIVWPGVTPAAVRIHRSARRSRMERRTALLLTSGVVGLWLLAVFANVLADASERSARLMREQAVNDDLQGRVLAGQLEIDVVQERSFQELLARGYGMGRQPERPFALALGAPPPPAITPLGQEDPVTRTTTPLEDWLDLLVGT